MKMELVYGLNGILRLLILPICMSVALPATIMLLFLHMNFQIARFLLLTVPLATVIFALGIGVILLTLSIIMKLQNIKELPLTIPD